MTDWVASATLSSDAGAVSEEESPCVSWGNVKSKFELHRCVSAPGATNLGKSNLERQCRCQGAFSGGGGTTPAEAAASAEDSCGPSVCVCVQWYNTAG